MNKSAAHADVRLKERTSLPPEVLDGLRRRLLQRRLSPGTHHVRLGQHGWAVLKDVKGRHVVATVLGRDMRPPGRDVGPVLYGKVSLHKIAAALSVVAGQAT